MKTYQATITIPPRESCKGMVANFRRLADIYKLKGAIDLNPGQPGGGVLTFDLEGENAGIDKYSETINSIIGNYNR